MEISLRPERERFIEQKIKSGKYADASAVIDDALGLLRITPRSLDELKEMIDVGIDQLDRGEGKEWNVDEFLSRARKRYGRT